MSTDQNKAVVRRFITEVLIGGNVDVADEVLAPNYVNRTMGTDRAAFKAFIATSPVFSERRFDIEDLVAEPRPSQGAEELRSRYRRFADQEELDG